MSVVARKAEGCRVCGVALPAPFLDLGLQPLANALEPTRAAALAAPVHPLALTRCLGCHVVQLTHAVDPGAMFSDYAYLSGASPSLRRHFETMAADLSSRVDHGPVLDVGCNDGVLLDAFRALGRKTVGVEPAANLVGRCRAGGHEVVHGFFDGAAAAAVLASVGRVPLVTANNVFAHLEDLGGFLSAVDAVLAAKGMFVFEVAWSLRMLLDGTFDQSYFEHVYHHSVLGLRTILERSGFVLERAEEVGTHGGSLRCQARRRGEGAADGPSVAAMLEREVDAGLDTSAPYALLAGRASKTRLDLVTAIRSACQAGRRVIGYGAPAKATTLLCWCGLGEGDVAFIVDDAQTKQGRWIPKAAIRVAEPGEMGPDDVVVVFPWNVAGDILPRLGRRTAIIPLPEVRVAPAG